MQVNDNFQAMVGCPLNCLLQIGKLTLDIWFSGIHIERPVADGNTNVVQANMTLGRVTSGAGRAIPCTSDGGDITFCDPSVPMVLEGTGRSSGVLVLAECPLVDNGAVACGIEDTRRDPRLSCCE